MVEGGFTLGVPGPTTAVPAHELEPLVQCTRGLSSMRFRALPRLPALLLRGTGQRWDPKVPQSWGGRQSLGDVVSSSWLLMALPGATQRHVSICGVFF